MTTFDVVLVVLAMVIAACVPLSHMYPLIVRWIERWRYGWALDDAASAHRKIVEGRDEMKPVSLTKYEFRAMRATTNDVITTGGETAAKVFNEGNGAIVPPDEVENGNDAK